MEYPLCEMPQDEFKKHGCSYSLISDGKRVCGSPCAEFFRKRLAAVEAERDEMRKQMLEELGRADILEHIVESVRARIAKIPLDVDKGGITIHKRENGSRFVWSTSEGDTKCKEAVADIIDILGGNGK